MDSVGKTVISAFVGVLGLIALYFAAHARDDGVYYAGLLIFVLAVVFVFYQLKRALDEAERGGGEGNA